MGAASPLTIYEDSDADASGVSVASTDCASCAPPLSPDDAAFYKLLRLVNGTDVRADDIVVPEWGHRSVDDILLVSSVDLPREQVDRPTMSRTQLLSDALLHAAALALFRFHQSDLEKFWMLNDHPMARLWRTLTKRPMRQHPRSQVVPASSSMAKGECIGISQSQEKRAYCSQPTVADIALVSLIRDTLPPELKSFTFTTIQLNRSIRPKIHRDSANVGLSMTLAIGPFMGGGLWQSSGPNANNARRDCVQYPPWRWNLMDGAQLHAVYPYAGERASIVLFTHDAVLGSISDTVHTQAAKLGVSSSAAHGLLDAQPVSRNYSTRMDWPLTSAVIEQAEATVHVGGYSFNDLRGVVQDNCGPSDEPTILSARSAAHVLPPRLLAMILMACLAKRSCAARPQMPAAAFQHPSGALAKGAVDTACRTLRLASLLGPPPLMPPIMQHASRSWYASPLSSSGRPVAAAQSSVWQQYSEVVAINGCHSTFFIGTEAGCRTLSRDKYSSPYPSGDSGHYRCVGTYGADDGVGCYSTQHHFLSLRRWLQVLYL
jgi:hypothetical protein